MDVALDSGLGSACEGNESDLCKAGVGAVNEAYKKAKAAKAAIAAEENA